MEAKFVIRTSYGAYVHRHSSGRELNYCMTAMIPEYLVTREQVNTIKADFPDQWHENGFEVYKIEMNEIRVYC